MARSDKGSAGGGKGGGRLAITGITPDSGLLEDGTTHYGVIPGMATVWLCHRIGTKAPAFVDRRITRLTRFLQELA